MEIAMRWIAVLLFLLSISGTIYSTPYYGVNIGKFTTHFHDVRGDVYVVDDKTLFIKNFNYDGIGPDAYFWAGSSNRPDNTGFILNFDKESSQPLEESHDQNMILHLPDDMKLENIRWLSVWSKKYLTSFGSIIFPKQLEPPRPLLIGSLQNTSRGVSSGNILILDSQTFLVPDFSYDGSKRGVYWWLSSGVGPSKEGIRLLEEERDSPLQEHTSKTAVITLPGGHSVFEFDILSIWNEEDNESYGSVEIPKNINIPPSPRTFGLEAEAETNKLNCEMLNDNLGFEVRWTIDGNDIIFHLTGNIEDSEYMALGWSKDDTETKLDSSDAVLAWIDRNGESHAVDYYLESSDQCENGHGMCPDVVRNEAKDNIEVINATMFGPRTTIVFKRPLKADDQVYDQNIYTDGPQAVLWAVGSISDGGIARSPKLRSRGNLLLDFGRDPIWNCPKPKEDVVSPELREHIHRIHCPSDHTFKLQIGPSERNKNQQVWYIDGLPAPELTVQRGTSYTFIVEGGTSSIKSRPFYITSSKEGGYLQKISEGNEASETFFAGITRDPNTGSYIPTTEGRLCEWRYSTSKPEDSIIASVLDSNNPLVLSCESGKSGNLTWIPDSNIPNTVYYQSFTEKNFGGKIKVMNFCEETNPVRYLENDFLSNRELGAKGYRSKSELELEHMFVDSDNVPNVKEHKASVEKEEHESEDNKGKEDISFNISYENNAYEASSSKVPIKSESWRRTDYSDEISDEVNQDSGKNVDNLKTETIPLRPQQIFVNNAEHPHDESERSDRNINQNKNLKEEPTTRKNEILESAHYPIENPEAHKILSSSVSSQSVEAALTKQNTRFKPHFEGGFIPLVLNPVKERELTLPQIPLNQFRRPYRPFLFNESIPFHGTFKPGVPDFSGFNISSYSQEEAQYSQSNYQDNVPMISAPKPQIVPKQVTPTNYQAEMLKRPKRPMYHQHMLLNGHWPRNPNFPPHPSHRPLLNLRIPSIHDELDQVSSQRVQVAFQLAGEDKGKQGIIPAFHALNMQNRRRNQHLNKGVHSPPIQRRPDIVGEESPSNLRPFKRITLNRNEASSSTFRKNSEPPRIPSELPVVAQNTPHLNRQSIPIEKELFKDSMNNGFRRIPPIGIERANGNFIQNKQRDPNFSNKQVSLPVSTLIHPTEEILKSVEKEMNIGTEDLTYKEKIPTRNPPFGVPDLPQFQNKNIHHQFHPNSRLIVRHNQNHPIHFIQDPRETQLKQNQIPVNNLRVQMIPGPLLQYQASTIPTNLINKNTNFDNIDESTGSSKSNSTLPSYRLSSSKIDSVAYPSEIEQDKGSLEGINESQEVSSHTADEQEYEVLNLDIPDKGNTDIELHLPEESSYHPSRDYDAPFGARLNTRNKINKPKENISSMIPKSPLNFLRKPQLPSSQEILESSNPNVEIKITQPSENHPKFNIELNGENDKSIPSESTTLETSAIESYKTEVQGSEDSILNLSSYSESNIPSPDEHEYISSKNYPGRKHILPNNSNYTSLPARPPDDINLPQISEKRPSHDNGTDYSILNHVLFIIGGQPSTEKSSQSSNA